MSNTKKIVDSLMSNIWLFENIFWKITDNVVYDENREKAKLILKKVFHKKDVDDLFPRELDMIKVNSTMDRLFQYYSSKELENERKPE